jgi:two-component system KDP operon response regulator KdpE
MVTVRNAEYDIVQALDAGADDYVIKPFRLGELVARMHALTRRLAPEPLTVIRSGALELDLNLRTLTRSGELVHLTPTEFDLLALLMNRRGALVTHVKLLRTVWGPEYGEELEYLRSYISALRKKIEEDPAKPRYIITEPWVGYRFCTPPRSLSE